MKKPAKLHQQNSVLWQENRQSGAAIPMESMNKTNGIVERNQWNRSTKPMDLFQKTGR
jgi:hypothetical protein